MQTRLPLTAEQCDFLSTHVSAIITDDADVVWLARTHCRTVFDVVLLIVHVRDEERDRGTISRLRAAIEAVVGPLPLALTIQELQTISTRIHTTQPNAPYEFT